MMNRESVLEYRLTDREGYYRIFQRAPKKISFLGTLYTVGEGIFETFRSEDLHLIRTSNSLAINEELLVMPRYPFYWVRVEFLRTDGTELTLLVTREHMVRYGERIHHTGYEPQIALKLGDWKRVPKHQVDLFLP